MEREKTDETSFAEKEKKIETKKRFYLSSGLYYKCFTIVIYDCNDIGLYYKPRDDHN